MFCPFCGIKNNAEQLSCFVCNKKLPSLDTDAPIPRQRNAPVSRPRVATPVARMQDRLLAVSLDLLFVGALMLVAGAALWSKFDVVRSVSVGAIAAIAACSSVLLIFSYTWIAEEVFGSTMGKAFANIRVVRREQPLSLGARAGVLAGWIGVMTAAVWGAITLCPRWFLG